MRAAALCALALCVAACHARQLYAAERESEWGRGGSRARQGATAAAVWRTAARAHSFPSQSLSPSLSAADPANPAALCDPVSNTTIEPPANSYPVFSLLGACAAFVCRACVADGDQRVWVAGAARGRATCDAVCSQQRLYHRIHNRTTSMQ